MKWSELFTPTSKQITALDAIKRSKFVLYGGARGGGKSWFLRWYLLQFLIEMYKQGYENARVMLACESYPVLQDRQTAKISTEFPMWLGEVKTTKTEGLGFYVRPEYLFKAYTRIREIMRFNPTNFLVPLDVSCSVGPNWGMLGEVHTITEDNKLVMNYKPLE